MRLFTLKNGQRDGRLALVSSDGARCIPTSEWTTLQAALEDWSRAEPALRLQARALDDGVAHGATAFDARQAMAPLPRAYQWCDGSAFLHHVRLLEKAFRLPPVPDVDTVPLLYQGASDDFLGPTDDALLPREEDGIDFEGEFGVITDEVPMGTTAADAVRHIRLVVLINDWSLRSFGPREMRTGFGFVHAKPSTAFAPFAVTPDELGEAWQDARVSLALQVSWNGRPFGQPNGRAMHFSFAQLIAHACHTRRLRAGTVIGSGTVSEDLEGVGSACIAELRMREAMEQGAPKTRFMRFGDHVKMEAIDAFGRAVFGRVEQQVLCSFAPATGMS